MTASTATISSIDHRDPATWTDAVFLSFDIDWAHDDVLRYCIDQVQQADVAATWFVTHDTPVLEELRANPKFELGIHPNFNFLLAGDDRNGRNAEEVIDRVMEIVPEAKSVRSHSITTSQRIIELFAARGLTHESNHYIPSNSRMDLKPWDSGKGLTVVPVVWTDATASIESNLDSLAPLARQTGLSVFNFHPIHVFLNTEDMDRYESCREDHYAPDRLINHRSQHPSGSGSMLGGLLEICRQDVG
ncbi:MAG: hypothetical protein MK089_08465 [Phycisphaerales bacterium]|nr:hypothetical protein [Phycisphaerales bacterium]